MNLTIELKNGKLFTTDPATIDQLRKSAYGWRSAKKMMFTPEEALYLVDVRNAKCTSADKPVNFNDIAAKFGKTGKLMPRYFAYKDWRDRGLAIRDASLKYANPHGASPKKYPSSKVSLRGYKLDGMFLGNDLLCVTDTKASKDLYEKHWFGQYGTYKAAERGKLCKFDAYETLYLAEKGVLKLKNATKSQVIKKATERRADFPKLYEVYKDWKDRGYVVKTGFKFGTHFRVYFPGARPVKDGNWVHSKHVIHVFPKESKLLISEWARAIRVAHSVRKTFILAVPGRAKAKKTKIDFILYHRKGGEADNPERAPPKYAMLPLGEEEYIGGAELSGAINEAAKRRLDLVLAIADRETAVTYYKVRRIALKGSKHDYYEIDWMQP
ncbi:MAG: tRNA-intron lyase [Candidatus Micrarchaeota archaeon]|nr:tRNA-intron lyase [Candidatus Micrarchaeota archaeon]